VSGSRCPRAHWPCPLVRGGADMAGNFPIVGGMKKAVSHVETTVSDG
jgi:hypothetical protein